MSAIDIIERSATHTTVRLPVSLINIRDGIWIDLPEMGADCHALFRDDHAILCLGESGCFAVHRHRMREFGEAVIELADVWEGVPT